MRVVVGFGINPEVSVRHSAATTQKVPAEIDMSIAGTSVNVAFSLRRHGHSVHLIGMIGRGCPYEGFLSQALRAQGVTHNLMRVKEKTSIAVVDLPESGPMTLFSEKSRYLKNPCEAVQRVVRQKRPTHIMATGVTPQDADLVEAMFDVVTSEVVRVFNPRFQLIQERQMFERLLAKSTVVSANEEEFLNYSGNGHVTFGDMAKLHRFGPQLVLVTQDARGAMLSTSTGITIRQPAVQIGKFADEVGAGDCFLAHFTHGLASGLGEAKAMEFAAAVAAIKVTKIGGSNVPTLDEIKHHLAQILTLAG